MKPGGTAEVIEKKMTEAMERYGTDAEGVTITWNFVQQTLHCCGVNGASDWDEQNKPKGKDSCWMDADCKNHYANCTKGTAFPFKAFGSVETSV